jgi:hypothetical protein
MLAVRGREGKRDYALLRVLGDCGLRSTSCAGCAARPARPGTAGATSAEAVYLTDSLQTGSCTLAFETP